MNNECNISERRQGRSGSHCIPEQVNKLLRKLLILVPAGVIGNIVYCLVTTDGEVLESVRNVHPGYLLGAALLSVVPWFTGSLRLFTWSSFLGSALPYREAFRVTVAADLGAAIAPLMVGGGAVKAGMLMNRGMKTGTALSLPVLENLEDGLFFLVAAPLAFSTPSSRDLLELGGVIQFKDFFSPLIAGLTVLGVILLLLLYGKRRERFRSFAKKIRFYVLTFLDTFRQIGRDGKRVLALTLLLTAVQWVSRYSIISLLLAGLGIPVRPVLFTALQILVFALTALVPTPGGAGGAEIFFSLLYHPFLPSPMAGLVTTGWRFFTFYLHTLLAALLSLAFGLVRTAERGTDAGCGAVDAFSSVLPDEELSFVGK